ncbi:hypothetical protein GQ53DRAFT_825889 [Thozetella sp. PMI_491]|nr:hypothetical protein GQ53DRAFT_825889 [Thozetella sp. PMI_491]
MIGCEQSTLPDCFADPFWGLELPLPAGDDEHALWKHEPPLLPADASAAFLVDLDWESVLTFPVSGPDILNSEQSSTVPESSSPSDFSWDASQFLHPFSPSSLSPLPPPTIAASSETDTGRETTIDPQPPQAPKVPISRHAILCCGKPFDPHALRIHKQRHHSNRRKRPPVPDTLACPTAGCTVKFKCQRSLDRHLRTACRPIGSDKPTNGPKPAWRCACDRQFVRWDKFLTHKCTAPPGSGTYTCVCGDIISNREEFERHHKTENGRPGRKPKAKEGHGG